MAHLTVPDLAESLIQAQQERAARYHRSLEDEVRAILEQAVAPDASQYGFGSRIHQRCAAIGGWALELPERPIKTLHPLL